MAIQLDVDLLVELGYRDLTPTQARELLKELYKAMETIVGLRIAEGMSDEQLDAFEKYFQAQDHAGAFAWLQRNVPDYEKTVEKTFGELKEELRQLSQSVLHPPGLADEGLGGEHSE